MKRDMDFVRDLLIKIADEDIDGIDLEDEKVIYHLEMLHTQGFVKGVIVDSTMDGMFCLWHSPRLTWDGNEFLDTIRPKGVWEKIKAVANEKGVGLTLESIAKIGSGVLSALLTDRLGSLA